MIAVDVNQLPLEGVFLEGQVTKDIFQLEDIQPLSTLDYSLKANLQGSFLFVRGKVTVDFELECVRCLRNFPFQVQLDPYHLELEIKKTEIVDLTERIREDILLALPDYPRCNEKLTDQKCEIDACYLSKKAPDKETTETIWKKLDSLGGSKELS